MNYWLLTKRDGTNIYIPPQSIEIVKKRWDTNLPIHTSQGSVPPYEIKSFEPSDKPYSDIPLLEEASRAFNEPLYTKDGAIKGKWMKRDVPIQMYNKHYSKISGYHYLGAIGSMVTVAMKMPIHQISRDMQYCTTDEINILDTQQ